MNTLSGKQDNQKIVRRSAHKTAIWLVACSLLFSPLSATSASLSGLPDFTELAETSGQAVVSVKAFSKNKAREATPNQRPNPREFIFPEFFYGPRAPRQPRAAAGSGFIIDAAGFVLTNAHVIEGMTHVTVTTQDGDVYEAEVIGTDAHTDIAVLKIESDKPFPIVAIGDSSVVRVGQWVAAMGSPYGLDQTLTAGIISAVRRRLESERYVPFIQTDAAINPGNSGGPLMDLEGRVIGINSQIVSPVQAFVGASFAIPINLAMSIQKRLRADGAIRRGYLGVFYHSLDKNTAEAYGLEGVDGVLINQVVARGPAADAGLLGGDVILSINSNSVSAENLAMLIGDFSPGDSIILSVFRDGEKLETEVLLGSLGGDDNVLLGLRVDDLNESLQQRIGIECGVVVREIAPNADTPEGIRQFRPNDIILHMLVNERYRPICNRADFAMALTENTKSTEVFRVQREGRHIIITVKK